MRDHKENMTEVGYRIKCAVNDSGSKMVDICNLLGWDKSTISQWATGKCYPQLSRLIDFCDLVGCSIGYIITGDGERKRKSASLGIREMKDLHERGVISDKVYYSFLEEKLEGLDYE